MPPAPRGCVCGPLLPSYVSPSGYAARARDLEPRQARARHGLVLQLLLVLLILVESPISGASLSPTCSTRSAVVAGGWYSLGLCLVTPPLGAQLAILAFRRGNKPRSVA